MYKGLGLGETETEGLPPKSQLKEGASDFSLVDAEKLMAGNSYGAIQPRVGIHLSVQCGRVAPSIIYKRPDLVVGSQNHSGLTLAKGKVAPCSRVGIPPRRAVLEYFQKWIPAKVGKCQ